MNKLLLSALLVFCLSLNPALATEFKHPSYLRFHMESLDDVFWCNLLCDGLPVDLNVPPPDYDAQTDHNLSRREEIGYEDEWRHYFNTEGRIITWNGIIFSPETNSPNSSDWCWNESLSGWEIYFNEMYYDGGPEHVLDDQTFDLFWGNLTFRDKPVDIHVAPPNYNPEQDYWRDVRSEIGYSWYWEYYLVSEIGLTPNTITDLEWCGIPFNGQHEPPNYIREDDPFYYSRIRRGHMDWWAMYFINEYGAGS